MSVDEFSGECSRRTRVGIFVISSADVTDFLRASMLAERFRQLLPLASLTIYTDTDRSFGVASHRLQSTSDLVSFGQERELDLAVVASPARGITKIGLEDGEPGKVLWALDGGIDPLVALVGPAQRATYLPMDHSGLFSDLVEVPSSDASVLQFAVEESDGPVMQIGTVWEFLGLMANCASVTTSQPSVLAVGRAFGKAVKYTGGDGLEQGFDEIDLVRYSKIWNERLISMAEAAFRSSERRENLRVESEMPELVKSLQAANEYLVRERSHLFDLEIDVLGDLRAEVKDARTARSRIAVLEAQLKSYEEQIAQSNQLISSLQIKARRGSLLLHSVRKARNRVASRKVRGYGAR